MLQWGVLREFNEKTTPNTKSNNGSVSKEIVALTTAELAKSTE